MKDRQCGFFIGDVVKWWWHLGVSSWETTEFTGIIVNSKWVKTDDEKINVFNVLLTDGSLCDVREDAGLELVA